MWAISVNFTEDSVSLVSTSTESDESSDDSSSTTSSINRRQHLPGASSYSESGSSWVSSIETLTAVEKLPQDSETLSKISSHVMHIVNPTDTSSQVRDRKLAAIKFYFCIHCVSSFLIQLIVINDLNDKPLGELVESIITSVKSQHSEIHSEVKNNENGAEDKKDVVSIQSASTGK